MKNFDRQNFILDYLNINWDILELNKNDPNHSMTKFLECMNQLLDKYIPAKKLTHKEYKRRFKPWINDEIFYKITNKNKIFNK